MDFLSFDQAKQAKKMGLPYPPDTNNANFGMLFESESPYFQYAFVGTGQWELFKQHCSDHGVFRATPTDLLRTLPCRYALFMEDKHGYGEEWVCQNLDQAIEDVFEEGTDLFRAGTPTEAVFKAWLSLNKKGNKI